MIALGLMAALIVSPFLFWYAGANTLAVLAAIFVLASMPSICRVLYMALQARELPKIVGGPSITWNGKRHISPTE